MNESRWKNSLYTFEGGTGPELEAVMVTSGTFVMHRDVPNWDQLGGFQAGSSQYLGTAEVSNPMPAKAPSYSILETAPAQFEADIKAGYQDAKIISHGELEGYAAQLVAIGKKIAVEPIDAMIVPYRGGVMPSLQLEVINQLAYPRIPIGFSRGSFPEHQKRIAEELIFHLERFKGKSDLALVVVDAAISGDSSFSMAEILTSIKSHFSTQAWRITFHLIYSTENPRHPWPKKSDGIVGLSAKDLIFQRDLHVVPSLLIEDWNAGLGMKAKWKDGHCYYKTTSTGQVIAKEPDGKVVVFSSMELPRLIQSFVAASVTRVMLSDRSLKLK